MHGGDKSEMGCGFAAFALSGYGFFKVPFNCSSFFFFIFYFLFVWDIRS
jgi:hypothetical protein